MKKNITKTTKTDKKVGDLVLEIFNHPDSPEWLLGGIHDCIADNSHGDAFDPEHIKSMMRGTRLEVSK